MAYVQFVASRDSFHCKKLDLQIQLYGHSSCYLKSGSVLIFGGFGRSCRSSSVWKVKGKCVQQLSIQSFSKKVQLDAIHGCSCHFELEGKSYVCLYGGRTSPNVICNNGEVVVLESSNDVLDLPRITLLSKIKPQLRFRASMVCLGTSLWMFGGKTPHSNVSLILKLHFSSTSLCPSQIIYWTGISTRFLAAYF